MNYFLGGRTKIKKVCDECGFKHQENIVCGAFVPSSFLNGRYDEPDTPRDYLSDEEKDTTPLNNDTTNPTSSNPSSTEPPPNTNLSNMFGAKSLKTAKTAAQKMEEAKVAANKAKEAAELRQKNQKKLEDESLLDSLHRKLTQREKSAMRHARSKIGRQAEKLNTPRFVSAIGYVRCNCIRGIPNDEPKEWLAVPHPRYVGEIELRSAFVKEKQWTKQLPPEKEVCNFVFLFLDANTLASASMVCTEWRDICLEQPHYLDLKYMEVVANFLTHDGKIEGVFCNRNRVYTAGTKVVKVWGIAHNHNGEQIYDQETGLETYTLLHTPVQDTAIITNVVKVNQSMYTTASNGAIREWVLAHNVQNIKFSGAMWEHSGWVNDLNCSHPTPATCSMHGIVNHTCLIYSSSDDRQVFVWDSVTRKRLGKIQPPNKTCGTMRELTLSDRHLFIGSSNGMIYVYPFEKTCERPDRHGCSLEAGPVRFCLQTTLQHGVKPITALQVGGRNYVMDKVSERAFRKTRILAMKCARNGISVIRLFFFCIHFGVHLACFWASPTNPLHKTIRLVKPATVLNFERLRIMLWS